VFYENNNILLKLILTIFISILIILEINAQGEPVHGSIREAGSGESLIGAYVQSKRNGKAVTTDAFGNFRITEAPTDTLLLLVTYVGYRPLDTMLVKPKFPLVLYMSPNAMLPTIVIQSKDADKRARSSLTVIDLPVELLNALPALAGETDPLKSLQLMPGISAGAEGTSDLYIRGGTPDQNLLLLDGAKIYNANHLFGFLSPFHPDLVKSIKVHKAGFPSRFGGRLSSVIEVDSEEGNKQKWERSGALGLINSRFKISGPLVKDKLSLSLGGRTAHLSLINLLTSNSESFQTYLFYDLNFKLNLKTDKSNLSLSVFRNYDRTAVEDRFLRQPLRGVFDYGNLTGSARWSYALGPRFTSVTLLTSNDYSYRAREESTSEIGGELFNASTSTISERNFKWEVKGDLSRAVAVEAGLEASNRTIRPRQLSTSNELIPISNIAPEHSNDGAVFGAVFVKPNDKLSVEAGLRLQAYELPEIDQLVTFLEPRLNTRFEFSERVSGVFSYAKMSQGLHMISNNFIGLPTNLWVTANGRVPPSSSHNYSLGFEIDRKNDQFTTDLYYKTGKNIIDPLPGVSFFQASTESWEDDISTGGEAEAYGLEFLYKRDEQKFFGWMAYTLSWNRIRYDDINEGKWYFRQFDRRHDLSVVGGVNLNERWQFLSTFVLNSGFRLTLPVALYYNGFDSQPIPVYRGRYNEKSPLYHRLDVSFQRKVVKKSGKFSTFSVGCYNVYGNRNPTYLLYETDNSSLVPGTTTLLPGTFSGTVRQFSFFTFVPFVNYSRSL
jgi:hypothetical protein